MSRNSSGTYTLPTGNPVVSGTVIEANWANTTLDDISAALTDSLSRSGKGGMSASLRIIDGSVSVPGWAFGNETGSGAYRSAAGDWYLTVLGSNIARFRASGVDVTGALGVSGNTTLNGQTLTLENSTAYYPQIINRNKTADANGAYFAFNKTRNGAVVQNGDVLGNLIFSGYDGAAYLQGAYINAVISATPGTNDMPTDLVFGTTPDGSAGPTERFRITSGGDALIRGGKGLAWYDSTNTGYWAQYNSSGALLFSNGTERMRLDASGNLGIGTSAPNEKLTVAGGIRTTGALVASSASSAGLDFAENKLRLISYGINTTTPGELSFWGVSSNASAGGERMFIDTSGNLKFNSGYGSVATAYGCRAWVNFNGTGTVAIRASGNVSSITDLQTGVYQVNFSNWMTDGNYAAVASFQVPSWTDLQIITYNFASNAYVIGISVNTSGTGVDAGLISSAVFR